MPRHPLPKMPKGYRHPGSGRPKGQPNRVSVEARVLVSELVNNAGYQHRLRRDFELRKVHPTIEALVWAYHIGKPRQDVTLTASVDINARLDEERRIFAALDLHDLEQLAAESQRLVDRAMELAKVRAGTLTPPLIDIPAEVSDGPKVSAESLTITGGSDNSGYVVTQQPATEDDDADDLPPS